MNSSELDRAEAILGVKFPADYRRFMETLPQEAPILFWRTPAFIAMINDCDRLAVANLELRKGGQLFGGAPWPDRYLAIGDDTGGKHYCLDKGEDPSPALLMYDFDYDDFAMMATSYSDLFARMKVQEAEVIDGEPDDGFDPRLVVTRAPAAWKSILRPIGLDEWTAYVQTDPALTYLGYQDDTNPFTGEVMRIKRPGYVVWKPAKGKSVPIEYASGRLTMEGKGTRKVEKMKEIARALNARLFGSGGAEIELV